jgi:1,4-dihydroxy-2-naphthoate octaprenyltransferase
MTFSAKAKNIFVSTRPWSFTMSLISVSIGTLLAAQDGPLSWFWFSLVCVGIVAFHAAANVLNDYFDTRYEVDQNDSPTARYRPHPLIGKLLTPRQLLIEAFILFAVTLGIGLTLSFVRSLWILWIGIIGIATSVFYTGWPVKLKYSGWGEVFVFLMWGPLMFEGAYLAQRQALSGKALLVSIPFGVLVALVLLANNIRDIAHDSRQHIRTISILLGNRRSIMLYAALILTAYFYMIVIVAFGLVSPWALLVLLSLPKAIKLVREFIHKVPEAADANTAQLNTIFGVLLIIGLILDRVV